jgi:hypothetical protein
MKAATNGMTMPNFTEYISREINALGQNAQAAAPPVAVAASHWA